MIDRILLFPYSLTLACRHALYNIGLFKSHKADVPTICVGNITVGANGEINLSDSDMYVVGTGNALRSAVVCFYLSNEGVSMLENAAHLGLPIPEKLKGILAQLHNRDEKTETTLGDGN